VQTSPDGTNVPNYIASCQGFLVNVNTAGTLTFNNDMRVTGNNTLMRSDEIDRFWVNLTKEDMGIFRQVLVGFYENATDGYHDGQDGQRLENGNNTDFYSIIQEDSRRFAIQNLSSFTTDKTIPLGIEIVESGNYTIRLAQLEGIFQTEQNVYLQDNSIGLIHNLSESDYEFSTEIGSNIDNRFKLKFANSPAGLQEDYFNKLSINPNPSSDLFYISCEHLEDASLAVFDLSGKQVIRSENIVSNNEPFVLNMIDFESGIYLLVITTETANITRKIVVQ